MFHTPRTSANTNLYGVDFLIKKDNILLAIKPKYAKAIYEGKKKVEFRKKLPKYDPVKIYLYESKPVQEITGEISDFFIHKLSLKRLLSLEKDANKGIFIDDVVKYFDGRKEGFAIIIKKVEKYKYPLYLDSEGFESAPQNYFYCRELSSMEDEDY